MRQRVPEGRQILAQRFSAGWADATPSPGGDGDDVRAYAPSRTPPFTCDHTKYATPANKIARITPSMR